MNHYIVYLWHIILYISYTSIKKKKRERERDFPGGPMVKKPPSNAGDVGSIPGQGTKIPHGVGQQSLHSTTTELACLNERAHVPQTTEPTR